MRKSTAAFFILTMLGLVPLWIVPYLPTQDGPIHLSIANVLLHYRDPATPVFKEYFLPSLIPHPNWTVYLILIPLLAVFPPTIAEKVLLSSYAILLPLSFLYFLRGVRKGPVDPPLLILPFVFNYTLLVGFYNFSISLVLCFFLLGYWFRNVRTMSPPRLIVLSLLGVLLYMSHIFSFVIALMTILVMTPALAFEERRQAARGSPDAAPPPLRIRASLARTLLAFAPGLLLTASYLHRQGLALESPRSVVWKIQGIAGVGALMVLDKLTVLPGVAMAGLLALLTALALRRRIRAPTPAAADGFLLLAIILLALYLIAPDAVSGGSFVLHRLNLFFFLFLVVWLELQERSPGVRRIAAVGAAAVTIALLGIHVRKFERLSADYSEYMSAAAMIEPNRTILPLRSWDDSLIPKERDPYGWRIHPFLRVAGYLSAERQVVSLDNYQASQSYFPIAYRKKVNPFATMNHPQRHFIDYSERTGGTIDYILLWTCDRIPVHGGDDGEDALRDLCSRIESRYDLVFRSPRSGSMRLYMLRGDGTPARSQAPRAPSGSPSPTAR
jgi:hypothetical protein